jgi:serine/threonine protein kinase
LEREDEVAVSLAVATAQAKRCPRCHENFPGDFRVCPRDATELSALIEHADDPLIGAVLSDSYQIVRSIGEGGMGRVYEARHKRLASKRFALKILHPHLARQSEVVSRFLREAEAISVLNHPSIVAVVDVNRAPDGRPYLVAELLEGEPLSDYLERSGRLQVAEAVRISRQICQALVEAHAHAIVHRDIKPENVFMVGRGAERRLKVLDFGISRLGEHGDGLTKTGMVMGTPAYMPPEQARGQHVDHRADIYAVGALLYQAVTGKRPFDHADPIATLAAVLSQEPVRPCTLVSSLPPGLELIIQKAMAKLPGERYGSMRELDAALRSFDAPAADAQQPLARPAEPIAGSPRARLVTLSLLAGVCALAGLLDAASSALRWFGGRETITLAERVLTLLGCVAVLIAPSVAWCRFVTRRVWPSTPRALAALHGLRRVLVSSLLVCGTLTLAIRVLEGFGRATKLGLGWPGWPVLVFSMALLVATSTWLSDLLQRRRR